MTERRVGAPQERGRTPINKWQERYLPDWYREAAIYLRRHPNDIEQLREYGLYISPRLQENAGARLHLPTEIAELQSQWTGRYRAEVAKTVTTQVQAFDRQNPKVTKLRGMGIMPVLVTEPAEVFATTLESYGNQDMDPTEWRLFTYFNFHGVPTDDQKDAVRDKYRAVLDAQRNGLPVVAAFENYAAPQAIGSVRAYAWDLALEYLRQKRVDNDVMGISQDADAIGRSASYVRRFCEAAEQHPDKDIFTGQHLWKPVGEPGTEGNKAMAYLEFLYEEFRSGLDMAYTIDGNMGFRMSSYAGAGGFKDDETNETQILTYFIELARGYTDAPMWAGTDRTGLFLPDIYLRSDSRRQAHCIAKGLPPHLAWNEVPFSTEFDGMRTVDAPSPPKPFNAISAARVMEADLFDARIIPITPQLRAKMEAEKRRLGIAA